MTELTGTLEGVGLPSIVRFLSGLNSSGCLRISHEDWRGDVFFETGRVVSASFDTKRGTAAIDALVQAFPAGSFAFDSDASVPDERNVTVDQATLEAHLDEVAAKTANGQPNLPSLDAIPYVAPGDEERNDQLPLDRATLQTLLAVDGQHSVRDIVGQRGTLDVLWQLSSLTDLGVVRLDGVAPARRNGHHRSDPPPPAPREPRPAADESQPAAASEPQPVTASEVQPAPPSDQEPAAATDQQPTIATDPQLAAATDRPHAAATDPEPAAVTERCPLLGFEDDPQACFGRPTRLHRCFAARSPLPLSLDQQRELCLTEHFGTCPRLASAAPPAQRVQSAVAEPAAPTPPSAPDDPRIVRLPFGARNPAVARAASNAAPATPTAAPSTTPSARPARVRAFNRDSPSAGRATQEPIAAQPTPLRARPERQSEHASAPIVDRPARPAERVVSHEPQVPEARRPEKPQETPAPRGLALPSILAALPLPVVAGGATLLLVGLLLIGVVLMRGGFLNSLTADDSLDPSQLPNASAVAAGTPITGLSIANARATAVPAQAAAADAAPTLEPTAAPTVATPTGQGMLLDESFANNSHNWPSNAQGTAWVVGGSYRVATRQSGQFVAIDAPLPGVQQLQDVVVNATFHKVGGAPGGGYGIIVRNQAPGSLDGSNQNGHYYVVEVGDKGEIGMWLRDNDHWVDLLAWQRSDAVRPGTAANDLTVRAVGDQLTLLVNGTQVASQTDSTLKAGGAGVFVGGDGNQVSVDHFSVQAP
ncbi:MAG: DUF4388 domain-containing protein [Chloroflexi bacterium]|nr:DUF4388 domain-containing protein [Chloroflexota bacterium]